MIVVQTSIPFDPDRMTEALDVVETMVERSRAEDGAVDYWVATDVGDADLVRFFEHYEDVESTRAHQQADYYREFVEALPALVDGELETIQFEADDVHVSRFTAETAVESLPDESAWLDGGPAKG